MEECRNGPDRVVELTVVIGTPSYHMFVNEDEPHESNPE